MQGYVSGVFVLVFAGLILVVWVLGCAFCGVMVSWKNLHIYFTLFFFFTFLLLLFLYIVVAMFSFAPMLSVHVMPRFYFHCFVVNPQSGKSFEKYLFIQTMSEKKGYGRSCDDL